MKTIICFFTGTGNPPAAAKKIAAMRLTRGEMDDSA